MQNSNMVTGTLSALPASALCNNQYDIIIIGSGVSCAYTVLNYVALLLKHPPQRSVRLAILDKSGEFWTGVAYGHRTGQHSLIISSLQEFFPQPELDNFKHWLSQNYSWVFDTPEQKMGLLANKWVSRHEPDMSAGLWDELFIPRYTVGLYLKERLDRLLQAAREVVECCLLTVDAVDIELVHDRYRIEVNTAHGQQAFLTANKVVLAIGSPPHKSNQLAAPTAAAGEYCYIENMYEPSQNSNIDNINEILRKSPDPQQNQVLIIGSNASALETIYSLSNHPKVLSLINKFIVISPNATFPHRICPATTSTEYEPQHLQALIQDPKPTAQKILAAVKKDVTAALAQQETVGSTYAVICRGVIDALQQLPLAEQKLFVTGYGVAVGKFQRRAGTEYLAVVEDLMRIGKLELLQGKFVRNLLLSNGQQGFEFVNGHSPATKIFTTPVSVVINCAGFQDLTTSSSTLIRNLIKRGICTPNDSKNGFDVNENFEAHQNFYLIGPLIAGNINSKFKIWHAESCARIIGLSQQLAGVLMQGDLPVAGGKLID
jgi:uncharacterized NAD(P)/FAD-binding protein YdhS